jgi:hypothetical protein
MLAAVNPGNAPQIAVVVEDEDVTNIELPTAPSFSLPAPGSQPALGTPIAPRMPAPLAEQPPSYSAGVTVTGRVVPDSGGSNTIFTIGKTVVFFGPRDGLSVQGPIRPDGTFEIRNVPPGNYDVRTLPLQLPSTSVRVAVEGKDISGIVLRLPDSRPGQ